MDFPKQPQLQSDTRRAHNETQPIHNQAVLSSKTKSNDDSFDQGPPTATAVSHFSIAQTPSLEQQQKEMQVRIANRSVVQGMMNARPSNGEANGKTSGRNAAVPNQSQQNNHTATIPVKNPQKDSAKKLQTSRSKKKLVAPAGTLNTHRGSGQSRNEEESRTSHTQKERIHHSTENRPVKEQTAAGEKSIKRSASKQSITDQQMTMKAHLQTRFVRDKPPKMRKQLTIDDMPEYTIRTITEQEESSNNFHPNETKLPSEIHSGAVSHQHHDSMNQEAVKNFIKEMESKQQKEQEQSKKPKRRMSERKLSSNQKVKDK